MRRQSRGGRVEASDWRWESRGSRAEVQGREVAEKRPSKGDKTESTEQR